MLPYTAVNFVGNVLCVPKLFAVLVALLNQGCQASATGLFLAKFTKQAFPMQYLQIIEKIVNGPYHC